MGRMILIILLLVPSQSFCDSKAVSATGPVGAYFSAIQLYQFEHPGKVPDVETLNSYLDPNFVRENESRVYFLDKEVPFRQGRILAINSDIIVEDRKHIDGRYVLYINEKANNKPTIEWLNEGEARSVFNEADVDLKTSGVWVQGMTSPEHAEEFFKRLPEDKKKSLLNRLESHYGLTIDHEGKVIPIINENSQGSESVVTSMEMREEEKTHREIQIEGNDDYRQPAEEKEASENRFIWWTWVIGVIILLGTIGGIMATRKMKNL